MNDGQGQDVLSNVEPASVGEVERCETLVRDALVAKCRGAIKCGTYETPARLDGAVDRLAGDLGLEGEMPPAWAKGR